MRVFIYSLREKIYEGEADILTLPTANGEIGVLNNHVSLVTPISKGKVKIRKGSGFDEADSVFEIDGGFAQINPRETILLVG